MTSLPTISILTVTLQLLESIIIWKSLVKIPVNLVEICIRRAVGLNLPRITFGQAKFNFNLILD